jgi:predicted nucleic acid-binding protein
VAISSISVAELYAGVRDGAEIQALKDLLDTLEIIDLNRDIAQAGGLIRREHGKAHGVGLNDALIAATAVNRKACLYTLNIKHYPSLQEMGLKGFNLTIWHGLYAPKGTPAAITTALNDAMKKALKDPEFIKKQEALGALVVTDKRVDPAEHKKFVAAEIQKIKVAVDASGKYAD